MHMRSKCLPVLNVPRPNIYIPENTRLSRNWPSIASIPCCQMVPFSMIYPFDDMRKLKNNLHQMVYSRLFFFLLWKVSNIYRSQKTSVMNVCTHHPA